MLGGVTFVALPWLLLPLRGLGLALAPPAAPTGSLKLLQSPQDVHTLAQSQDLQYCISLVENRRKSLEKCTVDCSEGALCTPNLALSLLEDIPKPEQTTGTHVGFGLWAAERAGSFFQLWGLVWMSRAAGSSKALLFK